MTINVAWQEDCRFKVVTEEQHEFFVDADNALAPCPTEVLLAALGSCSATDVVLGLKEQGVDLKNLSNDLSYTLTEQSPQLYESVNLHFTIEATEVTEHQVDTAISEADSKYCHVCLMLQPTNRISHTFDLERVVP